MSDILEKVDVKVKEYNKIYNLPVKEFEVFTTLALIYFAEKKCDFVILETGLGGIYDCTNIADGMISIIGNIGYDHMAILGNTLEEITKNKAGIIKKNNDTVMFFQEKITDLIEEKCKEENNTLHIVRKEDVTNYSFNDEYQRLDYREYKNVEINLKGECQIYNAAVVLECINILREKNYKINEDAIREGLKTVVHKARFEILSKNPRIIYDGGHNESAIKNLKNTIKMYYPEKRKVYILSILKTKDYKTVIKLLAEDSSGIFIFTTGNDSEIYVAKEELLNEAKKYLSEENLYTEELDSAIKMAKEKYKEDVIMIIGSFYIYADVERYVKTLSEV